MKNIVFAFSLFVPVFSSAQDMSFLSPTLKDKVTVAFEELYLSPISDGPRVEEQKASVLAPLYENYEITRSGLSLTGRGQRVVVSESMQFPQSGVRTPREFGSADVGLTWDEEDISANRFTASATFGYAGTRLFSGEDPPVIAANLFWENKRMDHSWYYFVNYSNNRTFLNNIPIFGFAYAMTGETYTAVFGLPFMFFNWRPNPWSFSSMLSPFGASVDAGFRFFGPLSLFTGASWSPRAYQIGMGSNRLILDEKQISAGLRAGFGPGKSVSIAYIYGFDREFKYGKGLFKKGTESLPLGNASGVQIKARWAF